MASHRPRHDRPNPQNVAFQRDPRPDLEPYCDGCGIAGWFPSQTTTRPQHAPLLGYDRECNQVLCLDCLGTHMHRTGVLHQP